MKKLLCILLSAVMLFGMTLGASAKTVSSGVRGINESGFSVQLAENVKFGKIMLNDKTKLTLSDLADFEPNPGDVIKIYMTANLFIDKDKKVLGSYLDDVTVSALRIGDIDVRTTASSGEGVATVTLDGNKTNSYIKIEFSKNPAYSGSKFSYNLYLSYKGARKAASRIQVKGRMAVNQIDVGADDYYVDLSEGATAKATASVRGVELYLGEYCSVTRNLTRGKTYSGIAITDILTQDESLFEKYPYLEQIYRLQTVGLKTSGNIVRFDLEDKYYVYNTNGVYIGTSDKELPYWTKYYLCLKKYDKLVLK